MKYDERICKILSNLIEVIPPEKRENYVIPVKDLVPEVKGTMTKHFLESLLNTLQIEYVIPGDDGECGLAVFLDRDIREVIRLTFEGSSEGIHSWITE